jgi:mannose/fructose/N-acetylgalactosamine-specific phosphotransferase system component IIB
VTQTVRFLRIDDRLLHGQVIVGWLPVLDVPFLVVSNQKVAQDPVRQDMMSLTVPDGVTLLFRAPADPLDSITFTEETMMVVASPKDAWECLQSGIRPDRLNVGGMHAREGKQELLEALHVSEEDREYFDKIIKSGIVPEFQPTPQNDPVLLTEVL